MKRRMSPMGLGRIKTVWRSVDAGAAGAIGGSQQYN
jgi:hypothetical protein